MCNSSTYICSLVALLIRSLWLVHIKYYYYTLHVTASVSCPVLILMMFRCSLSRTAASWGAPPPPARRAAPARTTTAPSPASAPRTGDRDVDYYLVCSPPPCHSIQYPACKLGQIYLAVYTTPGSAKVHPSHSEWYWEGCSAAVLQCCSTHTHTSRLR